MRGTYNDGWAKELSGLMSKGTLRHITLIGVGNPIKSDDSVGLYIISKLRRKYGTSPSKFVKIVQASSSESAISKIENKPGGKISEMLIVFDSIESNSPAGSIIFANVGDTKYGFFATHNVPLRLIPSVASNMSDIFVLGVQPANTEVGENLSEIVLVSADRIVSTIGELIEEVR